jgi:short-subunit dehydrogenase
VYAMKKTITITGTSDGIGKTGPRRLYANGHKIVVSGEHL